MRMALPLLRQQQIPTLLYKHSPRSKTFARRALCNHVIESRVFSTSLPRNAAKGLRGKRYVKPRKGVHAKETFKLAPRSKDGVAGTWPPVFEERKQALELEPRLADSKYREEVIRRCLKRELLIPNSGEEQPASQAETLDYVKLKREALAAEALDPYLGSQSRYEYREKVWKILEDLEGETVRSSKQDEDQMEQRSHHEEPKASKIENVFAIMAILGVYGIGAWFFGY